MHKSVEKMENSSLNNFTIEELRKIKKGRGSVQRARAEWLKKERANDRREMLNHLQRVEAHLKKVIIGQNLWTCPNCERKQLIIRPNAKKRRCSRCGFEVRT